MIRSELIKWLERPHLKKSDVWMLCFTPRGYLVGLGVSGFNLEEQHAIALALYKKYGRRMDRPRRLFLIREIRAMRRNLH